MNKQQKSNYIKYYLQRYGLRDSNKISICVYLNNYPTFLCLSYDVTSQGNTCDSYFWWSKRTEGSVFWDCRNKIEDLTDELLDQIILKFDNKDFLL